jgi:hypothetical protein
VAAVRVADFQCTEREDVFETTQLVRCSGILLEAMSSLMICDQVHPDRALETRACCSVTSYHTV